MDQETLINLVLVFFFLIVTTLVRGLKARKQKKEVTKKTQAAQPSGFSFFRKIRDQIQESLQELEKQARQQRQQQEPEPSDATFWDELSEDDRFHEDQEMPPETEKTYVRTRDRTGDPIQEMALENQVHDQEIKTPRSPKEVPPPALQHPYGRRPSLRQAVVWAEIIGKPVALKKEPPGSVF